MAELGYESKFVTPDHPRWVEWLEICNYTGWTPEGPLEPVLFRGFIKPFSSPLGVNQSFYNMLLEMKGKKKAIRLAVVGGAGLGKSYTAIHIAQILQPSFKVDQIVFSGEDYLRLQDTLEDGQVMMMEEPTYMASARGWQSEWQQAVVRTIESSRFQNNPLLIPVVNRGLLDKIVREHYVTIVIEMFERGIGRAYDYKQSQWVKDGKRYTLSDLAIYDPGVDLARCGRETCLSCPELETCNKYIWPQYERKREEWIKFYQTRDRETLEAKRNEKTAGDKFVELCDQAWDVSDLLKNEKGEYDTAIMQYQLKLERVLAQQVKRVLTARARGILKGTT